MLIILVSQKFLLYLHRWLLQILIVELTKNYKINKKCRKICVYHKKAVPLHPLSSREQINATKLT